MKTESITSRWRRWGAPRHDPAALGFGMAFVVLGALGILCSAGAAIDADMLSQLALILLGTAGLASLLVSGKRPR